MSLQSQVFAACKHNKPRAINQGMWLLHYSITIRRQDTNIVKYEHRKERKIQLCAPTSRP